MTEGVILDNIENVQGLIISMILIMLLMLNTLQGWAFPWKDAGGPQHPRPGNLKSFKVFESIHQKLKFSKVLFSKFLKAFIKSFNFKSF